MPLASLSSKFCGASTFEEPCHVSVCFPPRAAYVPLSSFLPVAAASLRLFASVRTGRDPDGGNAGYVANVDWFEFSRNSEREDLKALYEEALQYLENKDQYASDDIERLEGAVETAESVLSAADPASEEIQAAISSLNQAIGRLHTVTDKTNLNDLLAQAKALDTAHWTEESRARLESAIEYAEQAAADENAAQAVVSMAERLLSDAMENAEETAEGDKVVLNAQISQGTAVGPTGYTEESYSRLQEALEALLQKEEKKREGWHKRRKLSA